MTHSGARGHIIGKEIKHELLILNQQSASILKSKVYAEVHESAVSIFVSN